MMINQNQLDHEKLKSFKKNHPSFEYFFNKIAWSAITLVVIYAASKLDKLSESVTELNRNLAVVVYQLQSVEKQNEIFRSKFDDVDVRLRKIESGKYGGR